MLAHMTSRPLFRIVIVMIAMSAVFAHYRVSGLNARHSALDMTDEAKAEMMQVDPDSLARSLNAIEPTS